MRSRFFWSSVIAGLVALSLACGGTPTGASKTASLSIALKDSPFSDARAVLVSFSSVSVHASGGDWTTLPFAAGATARTCDLKQLTNAQDVLGTGPLPAGHYTQIRLTITSAALYFDNAAATGPCAPTIAAPAGRSATLDIPSAQYILNREFDVADGNAALIVLDFDGNQSISQTGNGSYKMNPVITVVSVQ